MNIFVFTAGIQAAQDHLKDTVDNSIAFEILQKHLDSKDLDILRKKCPGNEFYCWGAVPGQNNLRNWNAINEGDKILSYWGRHYHHLSTIVLKTQNYELAKELWGSDNEGKTWEYIYFFKKPNKFQQPIPAEDSSEYLQSRYMGFAKIRDDKAKRIIEEFGSLEAFLDGIPSITQHKEKIVTPLNSKNEMNILTAIKTKPFILLAGISGTGKSRLVRTLAYQTCPARLQDEEQKKPGNYELIPVRPNWHDSSELMGYVSRINGEKYIITAFLKFIAKAWKNVDTPFFLCLDEMNLAPVEQYFAEYLSIIETRQVKNDKLVTDFIIARAGFEDKRLYDKLLEDLDLDKQTFSDGISIPKNLVVIGTVNMDETTHSFSRKVLDRAMTFEMNEVDLLAGLDLEQNDWSYPEEIIEINQVVGEFTSGSEVYNDTFKDRNKVLDFLQNVNRELEGSPFKIAYRVRDEFLIYCYHASQNDSNTNWLIEALDEMTSMKILSRIEGDENKTQHILSNLLKVITSDYKKSHSKLLEMQNRLQSSGYTSFWS